MIQSRKNSFANLLLATLIGFAGIVSAQESTDRPGKPSMAVLTPKIGENVGDYASKRLANKLQLLQEELEKALISIRKFNVVTRSKEKMESISREQNFSSSSMSSGNAANKGGMDAANYLVQPSVNDFVFYRSAVPVPNIDNKYFRQDSGRLWIYVDVLETTSGQIKSSFFLKSSFATKKQIVNSRKGAPADRHFLSMAKQAGHQLAEQMLNTVFPIIAVKVDSNQVWMNRGNDGGLKTGDMLNIYSPGEALIDPYTGENIGTAERLIGQLKVERVNPKFTTGITVLGEDGQRPFVQKGDILRRPQAGE